MTNMPCFPLFFTNRERGGGGGQLQHIPGHANHSHIVLSTKKKLYMQPFGTFLYNFTAMRQLRNIPRDANHAHRVLSTKNIMQCFATFLYNSTAPQHTCHSHRVLSTKNVMCSALPLSCTTPQLWDSSATYLGMSVIHIEY
jgi:hypothetical protein